MTIFRKLIPLLLLAACSSANAESAHEIFEQSRSIVVSRDISQIKGFVFVRGTAEVRHITSHRDFSVAKLNAQQILLEHVFAEANGLKQSENLPGSNLHTILDFSFTGLQIVEVYRDEGCAVVVIALPSVEVERAVDAVR